MNDREKTRFRATRMGYIFQSFNLLPVLTALENVDSLVKRAFRVGSAA